MPSYYFYKLTTDDGGAPCVKGGLLSLAICKPGIRCSAKVGDVVFGFAANSLHRDNRLIYIARVTEKLGGADYYGDGRYAIRGDCIYRYTRTGYLQRPNARFHGAPSDLIHDLGKRPAFPRAHVLLSSDFRYYGSSLKECYKAAFPKLAEAIEGLGRGHRVHHPVELASELWQLLGVAWTNPEMQFTGKPTQAPRCGRSQRGGCYSSVASENFKR